MNNKPYDVFLCYNSDDKDSVETVAAYLKDNADLQPWFDKWTLVPGEPWGKNLENGLRSSRTCAVFIGKKGEGPWQKKEVDVALRKQVKDESFRVIPVLLPGAPKNPKLPDFLEGHMWVDLRVGLEDDDGLWRLECGIRGEAPERGRPKSS